MKNYFLFPFIAVLLAFFITSCSSDNSGSTTPSDDKVLLPLQQVNQ